MVRPWTIPVNIANVEHLTVLAGDLWIGALELNGDWGKAKVGCHGEVGNGSDHCF